jgi:urea transport system permease protein
MRRILAVLMCLFGLVTAAAAQPIDEPLAKFASTKFDDIEAGITGLAGSGNPRAIVILNALGAGNLVVQPAQRRAYI